MAQCCTDVFWRFFEEFNDATQKWDIWLILTMKCLTQCNAFCFFGVNAWHCQRKFCQFSDLARFPLKGRRPTFRVHDRLTRSCTRTTLPYRSVYENLLEAPNCAVVVNPLLIYHIPALCLSQLWLEQDFNIHASCARQIRPMFVFLHLYLKRDWEPATVICRT